MIPGMEPTVLAGPVEFSPGEIMAIVAVLAVLFVLLTAPGWAMVGWAFRRRRLGRGPGGTGRTWPAVVGGCATGLVLCAGVSALVAALVPHTFVSVGLVAVLASWLACWVLAAALNRSAAGGEGAATGTATTPDGWGG